MLEMQIGLSHYRFGIACICYQYANIQNTVANNGNIQVDSGTQKLQDVIQNAINALYNNAYHHPNLCDINIMRLISVLNINGNIAYFE